MFKIMNKYVVQFILIFPFKYFPTFKKRISISPFRFLVYDGDSSFLEFINFANRGCVSPCMKTTVYVTVYKSIIKGSEYCEAMNVWPYLLFYIVFFC